MVTSTIDIAVEIVSDIFVIRESYGITCILCARSGCNRAKHKSQALASGCMLNNWIIVIHMSFSAITYICVANYII